MLVLTRQVDEAIVVDGDIRITVVDLRNGKVRIGIDAPPDVLILREELIGQEPGRQQQQRRGRRR
jgi:carbon storage regulator